MRCMDCGYSCHEKCTENVTKNCTKYKAVTDGTMQQNLTGNGGDNGSVSSGIILTLVNTNLYPRSLEVYMTTKTKYFICTIFLGYMKVLINFAFNVTSKLIACEL